MKIIKLLIVIVSLLTLSCAKEDESKVVSNQPHGVALPDFSKSATDTRLGIGRCYNVSNQWTAAQWTFKGDFNGDKLWDVISINGTQAYVKLSH
ncbi:MAG: hypothetical protein JST69_01085 [Bacteroidetes bacterium]|nr:hypothetical protein [Bacteroidota bacterium]